MNQERLLTNKDDNSTTIENPEFNADDDVIETQEVPHGRQTDTFHSWLVCLAAFIETGIVFSIHNSYGLIYDKLISSEVASRSAAKTAWVGSLAIGINFGLSPLTTAATERFGFRLVTLSGIVLGCGGLLLSSFVNTIDSLFLTYGVLWGCGSSMIFLPTLMALRAYFQKHLSLANGVAASGSGICTFGATHIIRLLLDKIGIQWTFRIFSAFIAMLIFTLPILSTPTWFKRTYFTPDSKPRGLSLIFNREIFQIKSFVVLIIAIPLFLFGYFIPYVYLYRVALSYGISIENATWLIPAMSVASTIGKIGFGMVLSRWKIKPITLFQVSMFCMAFCQFIVPFARSYWILVLYVTLIGLFDSCFVGQIPVVVSNIVGIKLTGNALGTLFLFMAIMTMAGPPIAGLLYNSTSSYAIPFYTAGGTSMLGAFIMLVTIFPYFHKTNNSLNQCIENMNNNNNCENNVDDQAAAEEFLKISHTCIATASGAQLRVVEKLTAL